MNERQSRSRGRRGHLVMGEGPGVGSLPWGELVKKMGWIRNRLP